jgi:hypothetical protein
MISTRRLRQLLAAAIIATAAAMAAVPSALAAPHWVINKTALGSGSSETVLATAVAGFSEVRAKIGGVEVRLSCGNDVGSGTITGPNKDEASTVTLSECVMKSPSGCTVPSPIHIAELVSELQTSEAGGKGFDRFEPKSGGAFERITITGSACSVEGVYEVTGSISCELPENTEAVELECDANATSGSNVKIGSNAADALGKGRAHLTGANKGKTWGVAAP